MVIEVQNTKDDYKKFLTLHYSQYSKKSIPIVLVSLICVYNFSIGPNHYFNWGKFLITESSILIILFASLHLINLIRLNRSILKNSSLGEKKRITLSQNGISVDSISQSVTLSWENVISVYKNKDYIVYVLTHNKFGLIPIRFFESVAESEIFYSYIQNGILKTKSSGILNTSDINNPKTGKHLYFWGLVGLIPNLGVISGLILLYKGIFTYKNRILIAIGIASILFTFIFWIYISPRIVPMPNSHK